VAPHVPAPEHRAPRATRADDQLDPPALAQPEADDRPAPRRGAAGREPGPRGLDSPRLLRRPDGAGGPAL
jgi:hypothetical protein